MSDKINDKLKRLHNEALRAWLDLTANTETPPIMHAWSLVSAASACLTRRCWFNLGALKITPNQYVMLVGPAGVRKSTAVGFVKELLEDVHGLRFAPNSTAGRLQGLLSAFKGAKPENAVDEGIDEALKEVGGLNLTTDLEEELEDQQGSTHTLNRHALYVAEGELTTFIGMKMDEFINFLGDMWDKSGASEFKYSLKRETIRIGLPCLNILGGATPMHITTYLPPQSIGQGFTSRVIFIYEDEYNPVPWPEPLNATVLKGFKDLMRYIFEVMEGEFHIGQGVKEKVIRLYDYKIEIDDARFIHYAQRRQSHMLKVAMALAALRTSMTVEVEDIEDAHAMLVLAEVRMAESLGEYGMNPIALAHARIKDILRNSSEPLSITRLQMGCGSDIPKQDFGKALFTLIDTNVILEVKLRDPSGSIKNGYAWPRDTNPFKKHETVAIDYMLDEVGGTSSKRTSAAADRLSDLLDVKPGAPAKVPHVDLPETMEMAAESISLAAQGFNSVADKLRTFLNHRSNAND